MFTPTKGRHRKHNETTKQQTGAWKMKIFKI